MLLPIKTSGSKPPLFFVHGYHGILLAVGEDFAQELGADQPFYGFLANGFDGRQPVISDVQEMVLAYVDDIRRTWPAGPLRIGGMCQGCYVAVEIAGKLQAEGRETGPVILADPSPLRAGQDQRSRAIDPGQPQITRRLYDEARNFLLTKAAESDLPFDRTDPNHLHAATLAVMGAVTAFAKYVPKPFPGPVEMIMSAQRAPSFFHPLMPYQKLFPDLRVAHVLPWIHHELFRVGQKTVARLMRFMLEGEVASEEQTELQMQPMPSRAGSLP
jgi:thioesterase domain-containing protein